MRITKFPAIIIALTFLIGCSTTKHTSTDTLTKAPSYTEIFTKIDTAPPDIRQTANRILTRIMDAEGLYTIIGDLKPVSSVLIDSIRASLNTPALINMAREACRSLSNDKFTFRLSIGNYNNKIYYLEVWILRKDLVVQKILQHKTTFFFNGVKYYIDMNNLATRLLKGDFDNKYRIYGYLFGYPKYAVDFFCSPQSIDNAIHGLGVGYDRKGFTVKTFNPKGLFTYVIPIDHTPTKIDSSIYYKAEKILTEYKLRRQQNSYANGDTINQIALIRDWYKDLIRDYQ